MKHKLAKWYRAIWQTAHLMVGVPNYDNYLAQQRKHNPNAPVMTPQAFYDYCSKKRNGAKGGKCC